MAEPNGRGWLDSVMISSSLTIFLQQLPSPGAYCPNTWKESL